MSTLKRTSLRMPPELHRQAKIYAAQHETSLEDLMCTALLEKINRETAKEAKHERS